MKKLFAVMHYDYEDADYSDVTFVGTSKDECYDWIDQNFQDFISCEFSSKGNDKWLKSNFQIEIVELDDFSETLQKLLSMES